MSEREKRIREAISSVKWATGRAVDEIMQKPPSPVTPPLRAQNQPGDKDRLDMLVLAICKRVSMYADGAGFMLDPAMLQEAFETIGKCYLDELVREYSDSDHRNELMSQTWWDKKDE